MRKRKENCEEWNPAGPCPVQSFFRSEPAHSGSYYKSKMARLISISGQIKSYGIPELNEWLCIRQCERILTLPLVADRDWSRENPGNQIRFCRFLDVYIGCYEKVLKLLEGILFLKTHSE